MLNPWIFILLGFFVGAFGTLVGAGGGFILMPIFFFLYPNEPAAHLTAISLAVVFFNAFSGSVAYAFKKRIDYKSGIIFAIASIPGAVLGSLTVPHLSRKYFDPIFALFLILAGLYLFFKKTKEQNNTEESFTIKPYNMSVGIALSVVVGFISSLLGIGGGIIHVPALVYLLHFPVHMATATSHFILAIMALFGSLTHLYEGSLQQGFQHILFLAPGVIVGAQVGAKFSSKLKGNLIIRILALAIISVGIRLLLRSN